MAKKTLSAPGKRTTLEINDGELQGVPVKLTHLKRFALLFEPIRTAVSKKYPRTMPGGNPRAEPLVVHNYETFIREVKQIIREGITKKYFTADANVVQDVENLCRSDEGLDASAFTTTKGVPMKRNRAFGYMLTQFFQDTELVKKLYAEVKAETGMEKKG